VIGKQMHTKQDHQQDSQSRLDKPPKGNACIWRSRFHDSRTEDVDGKNKGYKYGEHHYSNEK
jgi:hypothetical protein